jgi:hypothetical protein
VRADRDAVATVDTQFFATFNELRTLSFVPDLNYPCRTLVYAEPVLLAFLFINCYETHDLFLSRGYLFPHQEARDPLNGLPVSLA